MRYKLVLILCLVCIDYALPATVWANRPTIARAYKVRADIRVLSYALQLFFNDVGRYPTNEEGLHVLVTPTTELKATVQYKSAGYVKNIPKDPWGTPYQYQFPGPHNPGKPDVWSFGADGKLGGENINSDIGNWPGSAETYIHLLEANAWWSAVLFSILIGALIGMIVGLPSYLVGLYKKKSIGSSLIDSLHGRHLRVLIIWMCILPMILLSLYSFLEKIS